MIDIKPINSGGFYPNASDNAMRLNTQILLPYQFVFRERIHLIAFY
jgi:hypothetical protein